MSSDRVSREYSREYRNQTLPRLLASGVLLMMWDGPVDVQLRIETATNLGAMLILGRPIALVVAPGAVLPAGLARAADTIVFDFQTGDPDAEERLRVALLQYTRPQEAPHVPH